MRSDLGLLLSRAFLGTAFAANGAQKALGWFGGHGHAAYVGYMKQLGFPDPELAANAAIASEVGGGVLMALGALGPVGPAAAIGTMLVAMGAVHAQNGFFAAKNGVEFPALYAAGALALASSGYGALSVDGVLGIEESSPSVTLVALLIAVTAAGLVLARRVPPPSAPNAQAEETASN